MPGDALRRGFISLAQVVSARILNAVSRTGVGCEVFVPLGFVNLLHLVKCLANEGTSRLEHPMTLCG
jgi:hypothetical protein